jgi:hypothetical protein
MVLVFPPVGRVETEPTWYACCTSPSIVMSVEQLVQ